MHVASSHYTKSNEALFHRFPFDGKRLFCIEPRERLAALWHPEEGAWLGIPFEEVPQDADYLDDEKVESIAPVAPWPAMAEEAKKKEGKVKAYWEELIRTSPHQVIGYTDAAYGSDRFLSMESGELSDEEYAALIRDFREHGYFYTGEDFQDSCRECAPVLDNYRWIDFSRRGFGRLVAEARGDYSAMGYCHYTEAIFYAEKDKRYPDGERNQGVAIPPLKLEIGRRTAAFLAKSKVFAERVWLALPFSKDAESHYWVGDVVTLSSNGYQEDWLVEGILEFRDESEYETYRDSRDITLVFTEDPVIGKPLLLLSRQDC